MSSDARRDHSMSFRTPPKVPAPPPKLHYVHPSADFLQTISPSDDSLIARPVSAAAAKKRNTPPLSFSSRLTRSPSLTRLALSPQTSPLKLPSTSPDLDSPTASLSSSASSAATSAASSPFIAAKASFSPKFSPKFSPLSLPPTRRPVSAVRTVPSSTTTSRVVEWNEVSREAAVALLHSVAQEERDKRARAAAEAHTLEQTRLAALEAQQELERKRAEDVAAHNAKEDKLAQIAFDQGMDCLQSKPITAISEVAATPLPYIDTDTVSEKQLRLAFACFDCAVLPKRHASACHQLACFYALGLGGCIVDENKSIHYWSIAALTLGESALELAVMLRQKDSIAHARQATQWIKKGAEMGHRHCQLLFANILRTGVAGTLRNYKQAEFYYELLLNNDGLAASSTSTTDEQQQRNPPPLILGPAARAARDEYPSTNHYVLQSLLTLIELYLSGGPGLPKDPERAFELATRAETLSTAAVKEGVGFYPARIQLTLGEMHWKGLGIPASHEKASSYLKQASASEDAFIRRNARRALALMIEEAEANAGKLKKKQHHHHALSTGGGENVPMPPDDFIDSVEAEVKWGLVKDFASLPTLASLLPLLPPIPSPPTNSEISQCTKIYDVYLCYHQGDCSWLAQALAKVLQEKFHYKVALSALHDPAPAEKTLLSPMSTKANSIVNSPKSSKRASLTNASSLAFNVGDLQYDGNFVNLKLDEASLRDAYSQIQLSRCFVSLMSTHLPLSLSARLQHRVALDWQLPYIALVEPDTKWRSSEERGCDVWDLPPADRLPEEMAQCFQHQPQSLSDRAEINRDYGDLQFTELATVIGPPGDESERSYYDAAISLKPPSPFVQDTVPFAVRLAQWRHDPASVETGESLLQRARDASQRDNFAAFEVFVAAANEGANPEAQYHLAKMISTGKGCQRDPLTALQWYLAAARQYVPDAAIEAAHLLKNGGFTPHAAGSTDPTPIRIDSALAFRFYQLAADLGSSRGVFYMADCYATGTGVEKNYAKAIETYDKIKQEGRFGTLKQISTLYEEGGFGIEKNSRKSFHALEDFVQQFPQFSSGVDYATVAHHLENGIGTSVDLPSALMFYQKAVATDSSNSGAKVAVERLTLKIAATRS